MTENDSLLLEELVVQKIRNSKAFRVPAISVVMYLASVLKHSKAPKTVKVDDVIKSCIEKKLIIRTSTGGGEDVRPRIYYSLGSV